MQILLRKEEVTLTELICRTSTDHKNGLFNYVTGHRKSYGQTVQ